MACGRQTIRRQTVEHTFGTLKAWMGATHFLTKTLKNVRTEMSLQVLAYNMKRMIDMFGVNRSFEQSLLTAAVGTLGSLLRIGYDARSSRANCRVFTQPRP